MRRVWGLLVLKGAELIPAKPATMPLGRSRMARTAATPHVVTPAAVTTAKVGSLSRMGGR